MSMETDQKAALLLEDGTLINGYGLGLQNVVVGEICFNTAMTGYQNVNRSIIFRPNHYVHEPTYRECWHKR